MSKTKDVTAPSTWQIMQEIQSYDPTGSNKEYMYDVELLQKLSKQSVNNTAENRRKVYDAYVAQKSKQKTSTQIPTSNYSFIQPLSYYTQMYAANNNNNSTVTGQGDKNISNVEQNAEYKALEDYLKSTNQGYDKDSIVNLAKSYGINNFTGDTAQAAQLLNLVKDNDAAIAAAMQDDSDDATIMGYSPEYRKQVSDYMNSVNLYGDKEQAKKLLKTYQSVMSPEDIQRFKYKTGLEMTPEEDAEYSARRRAAQEQLAGYQFQQMAKNGMNVGDYDTLRKNISNWEYLYSPELHNTFMEYYKPEIEYGQERKKYLQQGHELQGTIDDLKARDFIQGIHDAQNNALQTGVHIATTGFRLPAELIYGTASDLKRELNGEAVWNGVGDWAKRRANNAFEGNGTYLTDVAGSTGSGIADFAIDTITDPMTWLTGVPKLKGIPRTGSTVKGASKGFRGPIIDITPKPKGFIEGVKYLPEGNSIVATNSKALTVRPDITPVRRNSLMVRPNTLPVKYSTPLVKGGASNYNPYYIEYGLPLSQGGIDSAPTLGGSQFDMKVPLTDLQYKPKTETIQVGTWGSPEYQKAFGEARRAGLKTFPWKGKIHSTELGNPVKDVVVKSRPEGYPVGSTFIPVDTDILYGSGAAVNNPYWNLENKYSTYPGTNDAYVNTYLTGMTVKRPEVYTNK